MIAERHRVVMDSVGQRLVSGAPAMASLLTTSADLANQLVEDPLVRAGMRLTVEEPSLRPESIVTFQGWIDAVATLTARAIDEGDARTDAAAHDVAEFLAATFTGTQMVSQILSGRADLHRRLHAGWRLVLPDLTVPEHTARWIAYCDGLFANHHRGAARTDNSAPPVAGGER